MEHLNFHLEDKVDSKIMSELIEKRVFTSEAEMPNIGATLNNLFYRTRGKFSVGLVILCGGYIDVGEAHALYDITHCDYNVKTYSLMGNNIMHAIRDYDELGKRIRKCITHIDGKEAEITRYMFSGNSIAKASKYFCVSEKYLSDVYETACISLRKSIYFNYIIMGIESNEYPNLLVFDDKISVFCSRRLAKGYGIITFEDLERVFNGCHTINDCIRALKNCNPSCKYHNEDINEIVRELISHGYLKVKHNSNSREANCDCDEVPASVVNMVTGYKGIVSETITITSSTILKANTKLMNIVGDKLRTGEYMLVSTTYLPRGEVGKYEYLVVYKEITNTMEDV